MASNVGQFLTITPSTLNFPPPLQKLINNSFTIKNTTDKYLVYKIKTTAPKRYVVRPGHGILSPHEDTQIQIMLQYTKDPQPNLDKDRFQVLSLPVDNNSTPPAELSENDIKVLLSNKENKPSEQILRCTFKPVVVMKNDDQSGSDFSFETPKKSNVGGGDLSFSNSGSGSAAGGGGSSGSGSSIADHHLYSTPLSKVPSSNESKHSDHYSSVKKVAPSPLNAASADHDIRSRYESEKRKNEDLNNRIQKLQADLLRLQPGPGGNPSLNNNNNSSPSPYVIVLIAVICLILGYIINSLF